MRRRPNAGGAASLCSGLHGTFRICERIKWLTHCWGEPKMPRQRATPIMVRRFLSSMLLLCSAAAVAQTPANRPQSSNGSTLQGLYEAAQRSQKSGNMSEAAGDYRDFMAEALGEVANSHAQIGDYGRADALFDEALILNPGSPAIERDYAATEFEAGNLKHAETLARGSFERRSGRPKRAGGGAPDSWADAASNEPESRG